MTSIHHPMIAYKTHAQIARERGHHDEKCQGTMQLMHTDTYGSSRMIEIHCDTCDERGNRQTMTTAELQRQRTAALAKGNKLRIAKANTRRAISQMTRRDGLKAVATLIVECPPHIAKMRLGDLLVWVRYVTRGKLPHYIPESQHASFNVRPDQILRDIPTQRRELIAERIERIAASK